MLSPDQTRLRISEAENARLRAEIERRTHNMEITIDFLEKAIPVLPGAYRPEIRSLVRQLKDAN